MLQRNLQLGQQISFQYLNFSRDCVDQVLCVGRDSNKMPVKVMTPTKALVDELRDLFLQKYKNSSPNESFHPVDVSRVADSDLWCTRYLEMYDLDLKVAFDKLWETCQWRKKYGANDLNEKNLRKEYLEDGVVFARNKDVDGNPLLIFKTKLHTKGAKDIEEVMRVVVYWIERLHRETNMQQLTVVFDMAGTGLSNMDLDFVKRIIDTFQSYYPNALNYILIFEMAWILNAAFKIIKTLLPAKALDILKTVTKKDIMTYVDKENCFTSWGGNDPYEYAFIPEKRENYKTALPTAGGDKCGDGPNKTVHKGNNNHNNSTGLKKVYFNEGLGDKASFEQENVAEKQRPQIEEIFEKMLRLSPNEYLNFSKSEGTESNVELTNISQIPVTYKIQTTSPEKFRVRPRCGILNPGENTRIAIFLKDHHLTESKDKFLIMCIPVPQGAELTTQQMSDVWKNKQFNSQEVEQHRLTCLYRSSEKPNGYLAGEKSEPKSFTEGAAADVSDLTSHASQLEKQLKFTQLLQCITLVFLFILSLAVVYLLKIQSGSGSDSDVASNVVGSTSCPTGGRI